MNHAGFAMASRASTRALFTVMNERNAHARLCFDIHSSSSIVDVDRVTPRQRRRNLMRSYSLLAGVLMLAGCSSSGEWTQGGAGEATEVPNATGTVQQKAQFADATLLNLVDPM